MKHQILGLHHVTATADEAEPTLDFYAGALGLRLVKKTVNFDNYHVFHFSVDETLPRLGQYLKLPPWEEPHRAEIEGGLAKVRVT